MDIEAFILTGGHSTRMGRDKATLELGGTTLVERAVAVARDAELFSQIRVVGKEHDDLVDIADTYENRGPLGGLHAALNAADAEWIFLIGCDLPFLASNLITHLASLRSVDIDAIVPVQSDGRVQPLCACYRVDPCLTAASNILGKDDGAALKDILTSVRSRTVAFDEIKGLPGSEYFFLNVNTPDDLETARRICGLTPVVAK